MKTEVGNKDATQNPKVSFLRILDGDPGWIGLWHIMAGRAMTKGKRSR